MNRNINLNISSSDEEVKNAKNVSCRRWFVLASGYFVMFLITGFAFNVSILIPELLHTFERSKAETALVQAITAGMTYAAGLGFSATFISATTSIGEYFNGKSKLMALAFLSFGSGCGGIVIPFILNALMDEFGWRGSLLIMGGLMAHMVCLFAVCKPVSIGISQNKESNSEENSKQGSFSFTYSLKSLVANKVYILLVIAMCFTLPVVISSKIFILDFLMTQGFNSDAQMKLYLCLQMGTALGGMVPGLLKKYIPHTSVLSIPAFFTIVGTTVYAFLPTAETYAHHALLLVCLGLTLGVGITTVSMTTMKLVGLQSYTVGLGILMTLIGISNSIGGPIAA
ncbi:monocarboxylate transporter 12-like [Pecten maximus]|uniref:monocarboxylate transporter 12-like n=1 Tax=Pecten maximus TaxID=6579 RepID=UPI00145828E7|nr:monocarboxylate transporter 12-like [Pecten maximus]